MKSRFLLILISVLLPACSFDHKKDDGQGQSSSASSVLDRPVSYTEAYQTVLGPRCVSCHSAGGGNQAGINLETFDVTVPLVPRIQKAALTDHTMPKGGALSDREAAVLGAWIAQGATREGVAPGKSRAAPEASWAAIRDGIFEKKCLDCHSPPNPEKGLDMTSPDIVRANISKIFDHAVVTQDMPLAPYEKLDVEEKQALAQWIALGMPQ